MKGIGVWTAHMFLIFALERTDVLPTGDLGIRNAIRKAYRLKLAHAGGNGADGPAAGGPSARWPVGTYGAAWKATPTCSIDESGLISTSR